MRKFEVEVGSLRAVIDEFAAICRQHKKMGHTEKEFILMAYCANGALKGVTEEVDSILMDRKTRPARDHVVSLQLVSLDPKSGRNFAFELDSRDGKPPRTVDSWHIIREFEREFPEMATSEIDKKFILGVGYRGEGPCPAAKKVESFVLQALEIHCEGEGSFKKAV